MTIKTNFKRFALSLAASLLIAGAAHADTTKAPIRLATTTSTE
ncbi:tungsten ABC transporter substrate-binding protein, partial [Aeromonas hydrophila]